MRIEDLRLRLELFDFILLLRALSILRHVRLFFEHGRRLLLVFLLAASLRRQNLVDLFLQVADLTGWRVLEYYLLLVLQTFQILVELFVLDLLIRSNRETLLLAPGEVLLEVLGRELADCLEALVLDG